MTGKTPEAVRLAHAVIDEIRNDIDAERLAVLRKKLPPRALQMEKAGEPVTFETLLPLARGPLAEFNRAAAGAASTALRFADINRVFPRNQPPAGPDWGHIFETQDVEAARAAVAQYGNYTRHGNEAALLARIGPRIDRDFLLFILEHSGTRSFTRYEDQKGQNHKVRKDSFILKIFENKNRHLLHDLFTRPQQMDSYDVVVAAAAMGKTDIVASLVTRYHQRFQGMPFVRAREAALINGHVEMFDYLQQRFPGQNVVDFLPMAISSDNVEILKRILPQDKDTVQDCPIIVFAALRNAAKTVRWLVEEKGYSLLPLLDNLHRLVSQRQPEIIALMVEKGLDVVMPLRAAIAQMPQTPETQAFILQLKDMLGEKGKEVTTDNSEHDHERLRRWQIEQLTQAVKEDNRSIAHFLLNSLIGSERTLRMAAYYNAWAYYGGNPRRQDTHDSYNYGGDRAVTPAADSEAALFAALRDIHSCVRFGKMQKALTGMDKLSADLGKIEALCAQENGAWIKPYYENMTRHLSETAFTLFQRVDLIQTLVTRVPQIKLDPARYASFLLRQEAWYDLLDLQEQGRLNVQELTDRYGRDIPQKLEMARRWRRVMPDNVPTPQKLLMCAPEYIRPAVYRDTQAFLKELKITNDNTYAYHLAAIFRSEERIMQYCDRWADRTCSPMDALSKLVRGLTLPAKGRVDVKAWGDALLRHGPEMAQYLRYADKMMPGTSLQETRIMAARHAYEGAQDYPELAAICLQFNQNEATFKKAAGLLSAYRANPPVKTIPDMTVPGEKFGMPGATFRRLEPGDPRGLFLGQYVNCCQHLTGHAASCAEHGFKSPDGGFYVVTDRDGVIIGQSWAWRGHDGEMVLDSFEPLGKRVNGEHWGAILREMAGILKQGHPEITALLCGAGGETPKLDLDKVQVPATPVDHQGYGDSIRQYLVWSRAPRAVQPRQPAAPAFGLHLQAQPQPQPPGPAQPG